MQGEAQIAAPSADDELALVRLAVSMARTRGCCEWSDQEIARVRNQPPAPGITPEAIKWLLFEHVQSGGELLQVKEERENWRDQRDYWYKAIIPFEGLPRGLFVEIIMVDPDRDCPSVEIVNAHAQR